MTNRDTNLKIPDIRSVRSLAMLLGKLHIYFAQRQSPPPRPYSYNPNHPEWRYGLGIAEALSYLEKKYNYIVLTNSPLHQVKHGNMIHEIKRTRQLMQMLRNLGLQTPEAGLYYAKKFVTRMRS